MKYAILSLLVLSMSSFAAESKASKKTVSTMSKAKPDTASGTLDIEGKSKKEEVVEDTALVMKPEDVKMDISCKAKDGHELKQGEKGYDACLQKVKNDKHNQEPSADIKVNLGK